MKHSGLSEGSFSNVKGGWGVSARTPRSISPICEMGLILLIAIGLLSCAFMMSCLTRWMEEGKPKTPTTLGLNSAPDSGKPFLVRSGNVNQTGSVARTHRTGTSSSSRRSALQSQSDGSEKLVHERIARHLAMRTAYRREE